MSKFDYDKIFARISLKMILKNSSLYMKISKWFFISLIICVGTISVNGQINVKVGYVPAIGSFSAINDLLKEYNSVNEDIIEVPFSELNFIHGLNVGFRYKFGNIALEADWSNLSRDRDVLLYFSQSDSFESNLYKVGLNSFAIGLDSYFDRYGFGVSLHSQRLRIRREIGSNDLNLVNDNNLALDLHINFTIQKSNKVSLVAKPYYRFSLKDYDLSGFSQDLLNQDSSKGPIGIYGVSLIFYNGKK